MPSQRLIVCVSDTPSHRLYVLASVRLSVSLSLSAFIHSSDDSNDCLSALRAKERAGILCVYWEVLSGFQGFPFDLLTLSTS